LRCIGAHDADARGLGADSSQGELVGRTTSGGYGWRLGKSLALDGPPNLGEPGTELEVTILGQRYSHGSSRKSPFDPKNERLRS